MHSRKAVTLLSGAITLSLALAACGGTTKNAGNKEDPGATGQPTSSASPAAAPVTISFWHAYSADSPEVKTLETVLIPKFEADNPGITVKDVAVPYDQLHQKLITSAAGGELPDVVRSDIIWVPELANLGVLVPLDQQMSDFQQLADATFAGPLATNKWKDHYYGLPLDTNTRVLMYNAGAMASAGVTQPPATFDELVADAPKLKAKGIFAFADNGASGWNMLPWIWSAGGDVLSPDLTKATGYLNSAKSVAGIQMLVDLFKQQAMPKIILGGQGGLATSDGLAKGNYGTILDGPWMFPIFQGQYPDFKLQTALVPAGPGGSISVVGGEDVVMTQSSKHKDAAAQFISYLLSPDAQTEMAKVGQMTVRKDMTDQLTAIHDYYGIFLQQLATARPRPPVPSWPKIDDALQTNIQKALQGTVTTQQALDDAAKQIDALLAAG